VFDSSAFRIRRLASRITQLDLSARSRVPNDKISRFESGLIRLGPAEMDRLLRALTSIERERFRRAVRKDAA
jgi:transcriptional regulator with XRE-family HTH domain